MFYAIYNIVLAVLQCINSKRASAACVWPDADCLAGFESNPLVIFCAQSLCAFVLYGKRQFVRDIPTCPRFGRQRRKSDGKSNHRSRCEAECKNQNEVNNDMHHPPDAMQPMVFRPCQAPSPTVRGKCVCCKCQHGTRNHRLIGADHQHKNDA